MNERKKQKRKKKKKKKVGLGWGNPDHYGAIGSGTGFDGGGMGESNLRSFIRLVIEKKESPVKEAMKKYGIEEPMKASPSHSVNSIGKSTKDGKWYGWSHRAIFGFGIGDKIFEENFGDDKTPFDKHGKKTIKNDADAKLSAIRFARSVS